MKTFFALALTLVSMNSFAETRRAVENFHLHTTRDTAEDSFCDIHTKMVIDYAASKITLTEAVSGACEIHVEPNQRTFQLQTQEDDGCGSTEIEGVRILGESVLTLKVTDNRGRLCENVIAAEIVVTEKTLRHGEITRYGKFVRGSN